MTDKEDKDVVVNLFKNANPKIMSKDLAAQTPKEEYQKMVLDSLETIKKDIDDLPFLVSHGSVKKCYNG